VPTHLGPGALTEQVTIQSRTASTDTQGGQSVTWGTLATVWASVTPWQTQPDETIRAGAVTAGSHYRVTLHYRGDVSPSMRVQWQPYQSASTRTLEIQGVSPSDGRRQYLVLDCVEAAA
jgi:SPP1 family predicted phage head-tail adaptor